MVFKPVWVNRVVYLQKLVCDQDIKHHNRNAELQNRNMEHNGVCNLQEAPMTSKNESVT